MSGAGFKFDISGSENNEVEKVIPEWDEQTDDDEAIQEKSNCLCRWCDDALTERLYTAIGCQLLAGGTLSHDDQCPLCRLFVRARTGAVDGAKKDAASSTVDHSDDDSPSDADSTSSAHSGLTWDIGNSLDDIILYSNSDHCLDLDGPIRIVPEQQIDIESVRTWLQKCEQLHGSFCNSANYIQNSFSNITLILVDVRDRCLVERAVDTRYIALSYVWGNVDQFLLTKSLYPGLQRTKSLDQYQDKISQVIKDAFEVAVRIGERYLWVDTLCIIQDSAEEKEIQIAHMASIYNAATMTVVAVDAMDANDGLPGVRAETRNLGQGVMEADILLCKRRNEAWVYRSRGWTYQEMMLSRRRLYFGDQQAILQCQRSRQSENRCEPTRIPLSDQWQNMIPEESSFNQYGQLVESYSDRMLKYWSDRLNAFAGVVGALHAAWGWNFVYGLPEEHFDAALLWFRASKTDHSSKVNEAFERSFPSWCWAYAKSDISFAHALAEISELEPFGAEAFEVWEKGRFRPILLPGTEADNSFKSINPPDINLEHCLRFTSQVVPCEKFIFSPTANFEYLQTAIEETTVDCAPIISSNGLWCGLLLGITSDRLQKVSTDCAPYLIALSTYPLSSSPIDRPYWTTGGLKYTFKQCFDPCSYPTGNYTTVNVMLVEWDNKVARRLAIGEIHMNEWKSCAAERQLIHLV